ncbi:MAG: hypothetical protein NW217_14135 [Hyphomicrobiaceae bacterium]|nr:hypothetical protein [Hyphomicrobiaceae bacterium]
MLNILKSATFAVLLATAAVAGTVVPFATAQAGYGDDCSKDGGLKGD